MCVETQVLQRLPRTGNEAAQRAERFGKRAVDQREPVFHAEMLGRASAVFAASQHRMRFVNENLRTMRVCDIEQFP